MQRSILIFAVMATLLNLAVATNYTVGAPSGGWDQSTDLQTWARSITFVAGDTLIFSYTLNHDVVEVPQADYSSCQITNPIQTYTGGSTVIPLTIPAKRYFVCGTAGHCASGMKVEIDVLAPNSPPPSSPPTTSPSSTPPMTPPPSSPSTSPVSSPSPKASSPAPAGSPDNSPPSPPSNTPASSPTSTPPTSSEVPPPPPPSSANREGFKTSLTMGFGLVVMMVLAF